MVIYFPLGVHLAFVLFKHVHFIFRISVHQWPWIQRRLVLVGGWWLCNVGTRARWNRRLSCSRFAGAYALWFIETARTYFCHSCSYYLAGDDCGTGCNFPAAIACGK